MWSTYAQALATVTRPPQPPPRVVDAPPHSSQPGLLRKRTRPRRPPRILRRHDPSFENSKRTSPTGPPEPDSSQLPWSCDVMAVRDRFHLPPRPRKQRTCPCVPFSPRSAAADRTDDEDVATSSNPVRWSGGTMRFFPSSRDKLGTSLDNVGRKKARPGRFWSSNLATCIGKGNLFFNVRVSIVPCTKV